jgi:HAD superfamily hydrolase (TIGR01509 family)
MLERVREITKQSYQEGVPVKEGVKELLDLLEDFGIRRCIATSSRKTRSEDILSRIGLLREFEFLLSGEEITHSKPHPEIFELAMARMGIPSTSTMIVEDSKNGILAAKASGAISVLIPDLLPVDAIMKENADLIFNSLLDLKDYLLELE